MIIEPVKRVPKTLAGCKYAWRVIMRDPSTGRVIMEGIWEYRYKRDANKFAKRLKDIC